MSKKSGKQGPEDTNQAAFRVVSKLIGRIEGTEPEQSDSESLSATRAKAGKIGGLKGGKARAAKLTPEQRSEIAKKASQKRWQKDQKPEGS